MTNVIGITGITFQKTESSLVSYVEMGNTTQKRSTQSDDKPSVAKQAATLALTAGKKSLNNVDQTEVSSAESTTLQLSHDEVELNTGSILFAAHRLELDLKLLELCHRILSFCDDKDVAVNIPRVCNALYNITDENGAFWQLKCKKKYREDAVKRTDISFKTHYFQSMY